MNPSHTLESLSPCSGQYSLKADLKLNAWLAVTAVVEGGSAYLLKHHTDWGPALRTIVTLSPFVPCLLYVRTFVRFVHGLDELQRRIEIECWSVAMLGTLLLTTAINSLNAHGLTVPGAEHGLGIWGALMVAFVLWGGMRVITCRRYR